MATVIVNDQPVDIGEERLNLIQAARKAGVFIPYYCWHPALTVVASCRMCLVEVGEKLPNGDVRMSPKVVPACQTPAKDGTVVYTNTDKARHAQQQTLEGLLLNHPLDCPVCDKAGECLLQDYSYRYGRSTSRMIEDKWLPPNKPDIGDDITLFTDRCIMCSRCVRFTREISGTAELNVIHRGEHAEIDIFPGEPCNNKLAGNVVDICPVGALCSKDFLYKQRVWFLHEEKSVCPDCSTGCSIYIDQNKNVVYRLRPRENPHAQGYFMCDEGRSDYAYINSPDRLTEPLVRRNGEQSPVSWENALPGLRRALSDAIKEGAASVAAVLSPFLTCEEAYLLAKWLKEQSAEVRLYLGHMPIDGEDDTYPKDRKGNPAEPVKFTIRAEKCPNRRGVEEIIRHFQGKLQSLPDMLSNIGNIKALYLTAAYSPRAGAWITEEQVDMLRSIPLLVVQDLFMSPAANAAKYLLPAATFAEKDGVFVNHANLAQRIRRAVTPERISRNDGQIFFELAQRRGLFHAATVRKEMARDIDYFGPLADNEPGSHGIFL